MSRLLTRARSATSVARCERGSAMIYGFGAVSLMLVGGGAVLDSGRAYLVKSRMTQAIDAAALAGGRNIDSANRDADIQAYFNANYPTNYLAATISPLTIAVNSTAGTIQVSATANVPTTIFNVAGIRQVTVGASATVTIEASGMELAPVTENTGSMDHNQKMSKKRTAADVLLDIVFGTADTASSLHSPPFPPSSR